MGRYRMLDDFVFGLNSTEKRKKLNDILEEITQKVDKLEREAKERGEFLDRAHLSYWRGRLELYAGNGRQAKQLLTVAVKLNPALTGAWNSLGEIVQQEKKHDLARWCYQSSLDQKPNRLGMVLLSKLLRSTLANAMDSDELNAMISQSLEIAKSALKGPDALKDGELWFNLGNAFLRMFLSSSGCPTRDRSTYLNRCLKAYNQAKQCKVHSYAQHPDLYINLGTTYKYLEEYQKALDNYEMAAKLDNSQGLTETWKLVESIDKAVKTKAGLKPRRVASLCNQVKAVADDGYKGVPFSALQEGANKGVAVACKLVDYLHKSTPFIVLMIDRGQTFMPVSIYSTGIPVQAALPIGVDVQLRTPTLKPIRVNFRGNQISYNAIHIPDPSNFVVKGKPLLRNYN